MANNFVQVGEDGTGKKFQTFENVIGSDDVHAEAVVLVDTAGAAVTSLAVSGTVNVGNFPATQLVSGTVNVGNFPATQPVSGTVNVGNFPASQTVSGTVTANQGGTWYVQSINSTSTVNSPNASNFLATVSGTVAATQSGTWTVQSNNASNFLTTVAGTVTAVQSNASNFLATIAGTVTAIQSNASNLLVTASQGGANWTVDHQKILGTTIDVNSGVKSAGTQRVVIATDQPQLTNKLLVTPDANTAFNLSQVVGTTVDVNSGNKSAGTQRVVLATDQPQLTNKLLVTPDANSSFNLSQVLGSTVVASVTGVQDTMPRKRTGSTGLSPTYVSGRISTSTTTTIVGSTVYLSSLHMTCASNAGTTWALTVRNGEATAKVLVPNFVLNANFGGSGTFQNPISFAYAEPIVCTSGINVVTVGGTPGNVDYFITYWS